jgi:hypothetical protein
MHLDVRGQSIEHGVTLGYVFGLIGCSWSAFSKLHLYKYTVRGLLIEKVLLSYKIHIPPKTSNVLAAILSTSHLSSLMCL